MQLPSYWLPLPAFELTDAHRTVFDALLDRTGDAAHAIAYDVDAPKWAFLNYAAVTRGLALHGSLNADITKFEPRQAQDLRAFGAQKAIYAAADGVWPMYFAVMDRKRFPEMTLVNGCISIEMPDGTFTPFSYLFSVPQHLIDLHPYTSGWVYLLPRATFAPDESLPFGPVKVHTTQLASPVAVTPLAKLEVTPADFPFLAQMRTHNDDRFEEYAHALMNALPWPE